MLLPTEQLGQVIYDEYNHYECCIIRDVTRYLRLLLRKEGHNFRSSSEMEIVRTIKEVLNI